MRAFSRFFRSTRRVKRFNAPSIAVNAISVESNEKSVATNATSVNINEPSVATNASSVVVNGTPVATNGTSVETNATCVDKYKNQLNAYFIEVFTNFVKFFL